MIRRYGLALALGAMMAAAPAGAWAGDATAGGVRTVLLIDHDGDPVGTRLRAELRALGFNVVEVTPGPATQPDAEVGLSARSAQAVAAVVVGADGGDVRVLALAAESEGLVLRATVAEDAEASVVALRAVEALRTSLGDLQWRSAAPAASAPTEERRPLAGVAKRPLQLGASVAPAFSLSPGESEPSWHVLAVVHALFWPRWGAEMLAVVPLSGTRQSEAEGSASVTYGLAAAGARWEALARGHQVADLGAGIGAAFIHVEGTPGPGFVGVTTNTAVATPYLRIGYSIAVVPWLRLRADGAAFLALPRPILTFAGRDTTGWGEPLVSGAIGLEVVSR